MAVKTKCLICGEEISQGDIPIKEKCDLCGETFVSYNYCRNNHHVCRECADKSLMKHAADVFQNSKSTNPVKIAEQIMDLPEFTMIGCKHYFVAALSVCTAYKNAGGYVNDFENTLQQIIDRTDLLPTSMCKFGGICGIPFAVGISSKMTGIKPRNDELNNLMSNRLSAFCIGKMFDSEYAGNAECCKRNTYLCIHASTIFIKNNYWVEMTLPSKIVCKYSKDNPKCNKDKCRLYLGKHSDNI